MNITEQNHDDAMESLFDAIAEYDESPVVCITHGQFAPCRCHGACEYSYDYRDVERVRLYQLGKMRSWR